MKLTVNFFLILFSIILSSYTNHSLTLTLVNPINIDRLDEPLVFNRKDLEKVLGNIPENKIPAFKNEQDKLIPIQLDDMDQDGQWDELFMLINFSAKESKDLSVKLMNKSDFPEIKPRTNIRFASATPPHDELSNVQRLKSTDNASSSNAFQMEGPAWENEMVAFRNYFDARNGIDIYGKRTPEMILDLVGINGQNYHKLDYWGMDILRVGNSLGAGAIALKIGDKIHRIDSANESSFRIITEGSLRSVITLNFKGWKVEDRNYDIEHQISIWGGARYYQSQIFVQGLQGDESLVTGIVNINSDSMYILEGDRLYTGIYTHDNQAYDGEKLGMGLLYEMDQFQGTITAPDRGDGIIQTYMVTLAIQPKSVTSFYFYVGWELEEPNFNQKEAFEEYLQKEAKRHSYPISLFWH